MKHFFLIILLIPMLTACPGSNRSKQKQKDDVQAFYNNNYNFTNWKKHAYKGIKFKLPSSFEVDYGTRYCYKSSALTRRNYTLGVLFTVERFTEDDLESELMYNTVVEDDILNAFHDAYVDRRFRSLDEAGVSFKKDLRKNVKFKGVIQTVAGRTSEYAEEDLYYITATMQVDQSYYVFQFISAKALMDYVYDDFERLLATVRKQ